jgi:hypothetical protein
MIPIVTTYLRKLKCARIGLKPAFCYGAELNYIDVLKLIASVAMVIDHVGAYVFPEHPVFRLVGRLAAPIFFFIAGMNASKRFDAQMLWGGIFLTGLTFVVDRSLFFNILLNFLFIRYAFSQGCIQPLQPDKYSRYLLIIIISDVFISPFLEYGSIGWLLAICGYWKSQGKIQDNWSIWMTMSVYYLISYFSFLQAGIVLNVWGCIFGMIVLSQLMSRYQMDWRCRAPKWVLACSRNTLWIYIIHFSMIKLWYYFYQVSN